MIRIGPATVHYTADGCYTAYDDGTSYAAQPHDTHHYAVIAHRCGYADDILAYCREHEVCHHIVGEAFYTGRSPVIWALAHGYEPSPRAAALEEAMVMTLQRFVRAGERPIIGGVDWDHLKQRTLEILP